MCDLCSRPVRRLKDVPFKELKVGDGIISLLGKHGVIFKIDPSDDNSVWIEWEDGNMSGWFHPDWKDGMRYLGRAEII